MAFGSYRFDLGSFRCLCLSDGAFNYPVGSFFANVPREHVQETLRRHGLPTEQITTPYTLLLVDTGSHRVLVDTGRATWESTQPRFSRASIIRRLLPVHCSTTSEPRRSNPRISIGWSSRTLTPITSAVRSTDPGSSCSGTLTTSSLKTNGISGPPK